MVIDMNYWTKVFRKLVLLVLSLIAIYLSFKLAFFYMPFLIAFVISLLLEPAIRLLMRRCKFRRKTSAIIVILVVLGIILGLLIWGIATLVSEGSNLLDNLGTYFTNASQMIQKFRKICDRTLKYSSFMAEFILKRSTRMDYLDPNHWSVPCCNFFITLLYLHR